MWKEEFYKEKFVENLCELEFKSEKIEKQHVTFMKPFSPCCLHYL